MTDLKKQYEEAEARAQKIMADRDEALQKVRDRFDDKLREANAEAAEAQKALNDTEAARALMDRPDGRAIADALGLELPE